MAYTSVTKLTDCPSNLKEAIDWVLRVTGKDGVDKSLKNSNIEALGTEVRVLLASLKGANLPDIRGIMGEIENDDGSGYGPISKLAKALRVFIGYDGGPRGTIEGTGIAMKPKSNSDRPYDGLSEWKKNNSAGYFFSYPREATWLRDVQHAGLMDGQKKAKEICALILLGCMPILYYGLTYIFWRCNYGTRDTWKDMRFDGKDGSTRAGGGGSLFEFMQNLGYMRHSLSHNRCGAVMKSVAKSLQDLDVSTYGGYSAFLNQLERNAKRNLKTYAGSYPLYGLYYAAYEYFKFQYQSNSNILYIKNMKSTLKNLGPSSSYGDFKKQIQTFISQVERNADAASAEPGSDGPRKPGSPETGSASHWTGGSSGHGTSSPERENENASGAAADTISSSMGYVAGGIVGTAAVGTGVALATNVGGVTTLIKGAIGMV
ncbi:variant erythrocyte surface antigen-1 family protein [Babesia caballi]|uniref:Variant erythrocyte surface antigen-1 family protein n=1 Tax=Babesia caballi TaxID=5871 RepID=A0AAV4LY59_BABCB|nr:variant erythrocyte surface antigen-1 family protein [Babesia caballi]